ncbi:MAG: hypothetical protein OXF41_06380 [bacterium]|nr:hypothetical protein [bacterium]
MPSTNQPPLRIGLLSVYFGLFDAAMPPEFRRDRTAFAESMSERLEQFGSVVYPGVVDSDKTGKEAGRVFAEVGVDVIVFAPTMAAPPSYGWEAIRNLPHVPLVAVGAQELEEVPDDYATEEATRRSLPVGLVMFTNVLVREGRPFTTLISSLGADDLDTALSETLRAVDAAAMVRNTRMLAIGAPISGYLDVEVSSEELESLGVEVIDIAGSEISAAFAAVDDVRTASLISDLRERFDGSAVDDPTLERSARLALAMDSLCRTHEATAGAVNCHGDTLRWNSGVGITACLGVALCTQEGRPFACTGDIPTGIALALGKKIAGSALYCELYQLDFPGNWILVANGGEGDLSIRAPSSTVRLLPEDHYLGDHGPGTAVAFELPEGPATLISLTPVNHTGGWVLAGAEGRILDSKHHAMEGPNGMFRFGSGDVAGAYARWCEAGATHHAGLLPGHHGDVLARTAEILGIAYTAV